MVEPPMGAGYGYVAVSLLKSRIPYQGRLLAPMIEMAWREVETRMPNWKPGIYRVFVYRLLEPVEEYQAAGVVVKDDGSFTLGKFLGPLSD